MNILEHHGEAADPDLLNWIKGVLDHLLGVGPWTLVVILGLLVVAIPVGIVAFYLVQQRRTGDNTHQIIRSR